MNSLILQKEGRSRCINEENPRGEKGGGGKAASNLGPGRKGSPCIQLLQPGETRTLAEIFGPGVIQHIWITVTDRTEKDYYVLRDLVLRMYWEEEETPSVESPLGDFFCCGFARGCQVNSMPITVNPTRGFNCYFPMPFRKKARITIENQHEAPISGFFYQVDYTLYDTLPEEISYFHAQWRRERLTQKRKDYTILDGVRGKGHYVGTYMALTTLERYWWGEGEVKMYLDGDKDYPTICGTGTEDYFGGAYDFSVEGQYHEYTTAYSGLSKVCKTDGYKFANQRFSMYRWHICDPVYFKEDIKVTIQALGWRTADWRYLQLQDDISSVAFWYQDTICKTFPELPDADYLEIN
jgi:hypothetical protein